MNFTEGRAAVKKYFGGTRGMSSLPSPCDKPQESPVIGVCVCGAALERHSNTLADALALPYAEAVWKFLLEVGVFHSYYGGADQRKTVEFLTHLETCSLDVEKCGLPKSDSVDEFNGTFTDTELHVPFFGASPTCKCGEYESATYWHNDPFGIEGTHTLGEIIFAVTQAGTKMEDK